MYPIEIYLCSKNGYFTPDEARNYYGRYSRDGITVHWWGDGTGADNHDNIVRYIYNGSVNGVKSVNYVLSDNKITLMVNPDDVAWASQSGNATTVSVETQPTLGAEGYKKWGWLKWQLEQRYGKGLPLFPHNYWYQTQCPGTISLDRIIQEHDKWVRGEYNPQPTPTPTPAPTPSPSPATVTFTQITAGTFVCNKQPTNLYQVNKNSWGEIGVVKSFNQGDKIDIYGVVKNSTLGTEWYVTKYSFDNKIPNGFSKADLDPYVAPIPVPPPTQDVVVTPITNKTLYTLANAKLINIKDGTVVKTYPIDTSIEIAGTATWQGMTYFLSKYAVDNNTKQGFLEGDLKPAPEPKPTPEPDVPEWQKNLKDIDDTVYWFKEDCDLIDITTGKPTGTKSFKKDDSFTASALTAANGVEYRITEYSYSKKIYNGVPTSKLTLTPPGVPDIPPVTNPDWVDKNVVIAFLEGIVKAITDFISKLKG